MYLQINEFLIKYCHLLFLNSFLVLTMSSECAEGIFDKTTKLYNYYFHELGDPRVEKWFLMSTPVPLVLIIASYLLLVYKIMPRLMENRKPYNLQTVLFYYNLFQIVTCVWIIYKIATPLSDPLCVMKCEHFTFSEAPKAVERVTVIYYAHLLKTVELIETIFFILRKKFTQVTTLHVYHHASTLVLSWVMGKYFGGGLAATSMMVNSATHVLMYTYYLVASLGPVWQKWIAKWKPVLTTVQICQLVFLFVHAIQGLVNPKCGLHPIAFYIYGPNAAINLFMFLKFYKDNYYTRQAAKKLL